MQRYSRWRKWCADLDKLLSDISNGFMHFSMRDGIDILIVAIVIYNLIALTKETRAFQVIKGLGILLVASQASQLLNMPTITWLLDQAIRAGSIAIVVLFQPELRRALEQIGRGKIFEKTGLLTKVLTDAEHVIKDISTSLLQMADRKVGALVIVERQTGLADLISTGTRIDGMVSSPLLVNIFEPNTPLHDGAVIIRKGIIIAAGCFLPLSESNGISRQLGTRHRAALGVSEVSDCVAFVVSEETGIISAAQEGKLTRYLDEESIRGILENMYIDKNVKKRVSFFQRRDER